LPSDAAEVRPSVETSVPKQWPVRPFIMFDASLDTPIHAPVFTVSDGTDPPWQLHLVPNELSTWTLGLEAGPARAAFITGVSLLTVWASTDGQVPPDGYSGHDTFLALGIGFRLKTD
jgi:hypothetical protein